MNDKAQKLYDLYLSQGLITESTGFDRFSSATPDQQEKLYELGKSKGLFKSSTVDDFKSAFQPQDQLTPEMAETGKRDEKKNPTESPSQGGESVSTTLSDDEEKATGTNPDEAGITKEQDAAPTGPTGADGDEGVTGTGTITSAMQDGLESESKINEYKRKEKDARAAAVGREQGKIVASEIGSTDDAIMPNTDVAISEKISKGIEQQQDRVLDSGAKMMYGWKGEDNYYVNLAINYYDEISPNKANDIRSEMENNSKFFDKTRDDLRSPSSDLVLLGLNIAADVANKNFNRAAAEAAPMRESLERLSPRMQEHLDRIDGKSYNGTEEQYNEYVALVKEAAGLWASPKMQERERYLSELEKINKDYENSPDVNLLDYYEEVKKNNQITTDNAFRKNNAVLDVAIPLYDAGAKGIITAFKGVVDFANNQLITDNKWGDSDDFADYFQRLSDTYEVNNPTPSKFSRDMFEEVVVIDGYEIAIKGGAPTGRVFAPNGYLATKKDSDRILNEYSLNPDEYESENNFNFRAGLYTSTSVGADMLLGLVPMGAVVSKGARALGMGAKVSGMIGVSTAVIVQSQNDFYQAAKEAGATDQEAASLAFTQAGVIALVALINPVEAKALMTITGTARRRLISQYVREFAAGVPRADVIQRFGRSAVVKAVAKKAGDIGWETLKEGAEETLEIPANELVARAWNYLGGVNTQTDTDMHDVLNTFGTAALGSLPFAFIGGGGSSRTRQELMYAATTDTEATRQLLRKSIGREIITESGEKITINDEYINKHIAQLEELKNVSSVYFTNKNITEEDKIAVTSLIAKKKGLEELSKIGGEAVKNSKKAEMEAIDAALGLYMDKKKGDAFYVLQGVAVTKEELEGKMTDPEWVKGFKAGRWSLKVSNDKEVENKLYAIYKSKDNAIQEQSPEGVDVQEPAAESGAVGEGDVRQEPAREGDTEAERQKITVEEEIQPVTEETLRDLENVPEPVIRGLAVKNLNGETLTEQEQQVYDAQTEAVEQMADDINLANKAEKEGIVVGSAAIEETADQAKQRKKKVLSQVSRAKRAISMILPNLEIVVHDTPESFLAAVPAAKGKEQSAGGAFWDGKIHINMKGANTRTVAHEVFHAVILRGYNVNNEADAKKVSELTKKMLAAVLRSGDKKFLNEKLSNGNTIAQEIERFSEGYKDESIRPEEQLAELTGHLAERFTTLDINTKTIIKAWIGRMAETLGINKLIGGEKLYSREMSDSDAIDLLNTIAGKTAKGEVITKAKELKDIYRSPSQRVDRTSEEVSRLEDANQDRLQDNNVTNTNKDEKKSRGTRLFSKPLEDAKSIAERYAKNNGIKRETFETITSSNFDKENAVEIAKEYDKMKDDPTNPEVRRSYEKMVEETLSQANEILKDGYTIEVNNTEPYSSSEDMISDLRDSKNMRIFSTESGFGDNPITDKQRSENPLLKDSGLKDKNGVPLLNNDVFRFVHDFFGHSELGNSFGAIGEENAWLNHATMYSPLARRAMTSETRGQNSWVNFSGANEKVFEIRDKARKLRAAGKTKKADALIEKVYNDMKFAEQKIGLLPEKYSNIDQAEAPLSELRGEVGGITYPDVVFAKSKTETQAEIAVEFYDNIINKFNEVFGRDLQVEASTSSDGNFSVTVEYETGLKPKYFAYPTGKIGEHEIVDNIDKNVPMTSLRHELIHEMLVKNITDKFERINNMDNSADIESIEEVQRNRAYNYSPEDVFYERVVEAVERAPDNVDTFDISSYGEDITNRLKKEIDGKPTKENVLAALKELLDGSNKWLKNNLNDIFKGLDYSKINDITDVSDVVGKKIKDKFENSRTIFPAELYGKMKEFTEYFNAQYKETSEAVNKPATRLQNNAVVENVQPFIETIKSVAKADEDGTTLNIDGTKYDKGGLVVPVGSKNMTQRTITAKSVADFIAANSAKISNSSFKVGLYKFPDSTKVSIDLNIVVPASNMKVALKVGKMLGQESLFNLDTFKNVKTGETGMNPVELTDQQVADLAISLEKNELPKGLPTRLQDNSPINATIDFQSRLGKTFSTSKTFKDQGHMDNYIRFMEKKGNKEVGVTTDKGAATSESTAPKKRRFANKAVV